MGTVGYEAQLFSAVVDVLKSAGPSFSIPVDANRVFQVNMPEQNAQLPALAVRLPQNPYDVGKWATTGNKRDAVFTVEVGLICQLPSDGTHPYGDDTHPGILTVSADIKNALENALATFRSATGTMVDFQTTSTMYQSEEPGIASATIAITFLTRYIAGNR